MRVVISGTHGSGKSTLIGDFAAAHREWAVLPDPFEFIDTAEESPGAAVFFQQLRIAAHRLLEPPEASVSPEVAVLPEVSVLAERGPLDSLAYLHALESLGRLGQSSSLLERGAELTHRSMAEVDLLVLLPLNEADPIEIGADEDLELREAMNLSLLELADDLDLVGEARVVEITGDHARRLALLEEAIDGRAPVAPGILAV